jgi:hypothetical protein
MTEQSFLFAIAEEDKPYSTVAWYRCAGIENFVNKVQQGAVIVGIAVDGNNIGLILDIDKVEPNKLTGQTPV